MFLYHLGLNGKPFPIICPLLCAKRNKDRKERFIVQQLGLVHERKELRFLLCAGHRKAVHVNQQYLQCHNYGKHQALGQKKVVLSPS